MSHVSDGFPKVYASGPVLRRRNSVAFAFEGIAKCDATGTLSVVVLVYCTGRPVRGAGRTWNGVYYSRTAVSRSLRNPVLLRRQ